MDKDVTGELIKIQQNIENVICKIPSGELRNAICDINILLLAAIDGQPVDLVEWR